MIRVNKIVFLLFIVFSFKFISAQEIENRKKIDSLLVLTKNADIQDKVTLYDNISRLFPKNYSDSIFYYSNLSIEAAKKDRSDFSFGEAYNSLGNSYYQINKFEEALGYFLKSKEYRTKTQDKTRIAAAYADLSRTYYHLKRYSESIDNFRISASLYLEDENWIKESEMLYNIANVYYQLNDLNKVLEYSIKAANILITNNITTGLGRIYNFIGYVHQALKNIDLAEEYYLKSYELYLKDNNNKGLATALNNLGTIYGDKRENQKAIEYYTRSYEYAKKISDNDGIATALNNIGYLNIELNQIEKGLKNYEESLRYSKDLDDQSGYVNTFNNIAAAYLKAGNLVKAEEYVNIALPMAKKLTELAIIQESYQILHRIYAKKGQFEKAYKYQGMQLAYNDSLYNQERTASVLEMQTRFETEAKEKEIQLLRKDNQISILEVERHKTFQKYLILSLSLLIVLIIVVFYNLRSRKKNNKLLSEKNFQLELANQKLVESEQNLRELNATKDKFFSIIAHDLKNPFNALLGFSELLEHNFDSYSREETKEYINVIYETSQSLFKLLDNLLQWSRTQTGSITYHPSSIELYPIIRQEVELLQVNADRKRIKVKILVDERTTAFADKIIISSVIRNLLNNAIKFTDINGRVEIWARESFENIEVSVSDSGIGIEPDDIDKLFRLDSTLTTKGTANEEGTGLGLLLCKEFVEKNNGKIWVTSKKGKGSTFYFTLPKKPADLPSNQTL